MLNNAYRLRGEDHAWTPDSVGKLQHAVRGNSREQYDAFSRAINDQNQRLLTIRGLMDLKFAEAPVPLDEVEPAAKIVLAGFLWEFTIRPFPSPFGSGPLFGSTLLGAHQGGMIAVTLAVLVFLVGFVFEKVDFTAFVLNLDESKPTMVLAVGFSF